jgi:hypothetical protein
MKKKRDNTNKNIIVDMKDKVFFFYFPKGSSLIHSFILLDCSFIKMLNKNNLKVLKNI